jgi:hypothetical protein
MVAGVNKILSHFGSQSLVGTQYQMSTELLIMEVGISTQPFTQDYIKYGDRATPSILKEIWARMHRFGFRLEIHTVQMPRPREGDRWFMIAVEAAGFSLQELRIINEFRQHQAVLFESDVFSADGYKLDEKYLSPRPPGSIWSELTFSLQNPSPKHLQLWKQALTQLAPGGRRPHRLGRFLAKAHKIWEWRFDSFLDTVHHQVGHNVDLYSASSEPSNRGRHRRYTYYATIPNVISEASFCTVKTPTSTTVLMNSHSLPPPPIPSPNTFLEVLQEWGCTWLWENLRIIGGTCLNVNAQASFSDDWIYEAIEDESLIAVTDGSYLRDFHPHLCSAATIIECSKGRGRLVLSFSDHCVQANAYRGELMGLLSIHLLLLSFNKVWTSLTGSVHIYSDCLGALNKGQHLPPHRIPSKCRHSDILKNIMVNCSSLTFKRYFSHVKSHQDDATAWEHLPRPAQLNCGCDHEAKRTITDSNLERLPPQRTFPLEPITLFVGGKKITTDSGSELRFAAQLVEAREVFSERKILSGEAFDQVSWQHVSLALTSVPKMFEIFACKQVFDISATFGFIHKQDPSTCPLCPSCTTDTETAGHILSCGEEGQVSALTLFSSTLLSWLNKVGTHRNLTFLLVKFIRGRGHQTMHEIYEQYNLPSSYDAFTRSQDMIGWRRFLEGMVSKKLFSLLQEIGLQPGYTMDLNTWMSELTTHLLEITHSLWIYRNVVVHDNAAGTHATRRKELLQTAIERQLELGSEGLAETDQWMLEVNLSDLDTTSGEREAYWLVAIEAARARHNIQLSHT